MTNCTFCSGKLEQILDMGNHALAGAFLKPEGFETEKKYPLRLGFCPACFALQVLDPVAPADLFGNYFYASSASKTVKAHFQSLASTIASRFQPARVVEIGCNDGVLLRELAARKIGAIGVDPSSMARGVEDQGFAIVNDYFGAPVAERLIDAVGHPEVVVACNVFAHIDDPNGFTQAVKTLLAPDGVFVVEVHHLGSMVQGLQYDWIYHEHRYYYSAHALAQHFARHGLRIFDVEPIDLHGGSVRYFVDKCIRPVAKNVEGLLWLEERQGLTRERTFHRFAVRADMHRARLREAVKGKVAGYGASGRANTVIQYAGLDLAYMVDDAPAKQGYYTPSSHIPIRDARALAEVDSIITFAWTYLDEIRAKCGLPMIVPFPEPHILPAERIAA